MIFKTLGFLFVCLLATTLNAQLIQGRLLLPAIQLGIQDNNVIVILPQGSSPVSVGLNNRTFVAVPPTNTSFDNSSGIIITIPSNSVPVQLTMSTFNSVVSFSDITVQLPASGNVLTIDFPAGGTISISSGSKKIIKVIGASSKDILKKNIR